MSTGSDKRICAICAWRGECVKRFKHQDNPLVDINCPDFSRDVTISNLTEQEKNDPLLLKGDHHYKYPYKE